MNELNSLLEIEQGRMLAWRNRIGPALMVLVVLLTAGCAASEQRPDACPQAQARFLTCANGVRLVSYEASFDLEKFCAPVQQIETQIRGFDRNKPLYVLADGERVMLVGVAGWLVLPKEPGIVDTPVTASAWWTNRACTLPSALR